MKSTWRQKLIGDKSFYKMVLLIAVPIMIQNISAQTAAVRSTMTCFH